MPEEEKISGRQFFFLVFCSLLSSSLFGLPNVLISQAKQDAWLTILVGVGFEAIIALILYFLGLRYPNQTMFQYSETILGKYLGKLVAAVFVMFFLAIAAILLRIYIDFLVVAAMPETPMIAFAILFLTVSTYAVHSGLEVIARLSELIGPILFIAILSISLFTFNIIHIENLLPAFQHSPLGIIKASVLPASWVGFYIVMGVFMAFHNKPREALKAKLGGTAVAGLLLILALFQTIAICGVDVSAQQLYPLFRAIRMIKVGDFFERLDSFGVTLWLAGSFVSLTVFHYSATIGLAQLMNVKRYRFLPPFVGLAILFLSLLLFHGTSDRWVFLSGTFPRLALGVETVLPMLLLIVSLIRHGKNPA